MRDLTSGTLQALGKTWHVPNDEAVTFRRFVEVVFAEISPPPRLRAAPEWGLTLAALFSPTIRAVREQLYQSERPWVVHSSKFERTFGWRAASLPRGDMGDSGLVRALARQCGLKARGPRSSAHRSGLIGPMPSPSAGCGP
jgi:hypothetical protein